MKIIFKRRFNFFDFVTIVIVTQAVEHNQNYWLYLALPFTAVFSGICERKLGFIY